MKPSTKDLLFRNVLTTADLTRLEIDMETLSQKIYFLNTSAQNIFDAELSHRFAKLLLEILQNENVLLNNKEGIAKILDEIKSELLKMAQVNIKIAIFPSEELVSEIAQHVKTLAGTNILINIEVDKNILGGAEISFKGKYKEYSLLPKIEQILQAYKK